MMPDLISVPVFAGKLPVLDGKLLPDSKGIKSENMRVGSGSMEPLLGLQSQGVSLPSSSLTIYLFNRAQSQWFSWDTVVDVARSPIADDEWARVYFTGDGVPQMTVPDIATQAGASRWPSTSYRLGIPAPVTPPVGVRDPATPSDTDALDVSVVYVVCYVSAYGEIGAPSDASSVVARPDGHGVDFLILPNAPSGNYNITHKRLYRSSGGSYQFVAELPIGQSSYSDTVLDQSLGDILPSDEWDMPHDDLKGLRFLPNGVGVGFFDNVLCFSEAYLPHAWPTNYRLTTDDPIVSIEITSRGIAITTEGKPYVCVGSTPGSMLLQDADINQACLSRRSHVDMGEYTLYASPDGLAVAPSSEENIPTKSILSKAQWQALSPSTMTAVLYDGHYIAQSSAGGFIYNPATQDITDLSVSWSAAYYDPQSDTLYVLNAGQLYAFDKGAPLTATFRTKQYLQPVSQAFTWGQVEADGYPVVWELYGDGQLIHSENVQDNKPFRVARPVHPYRKVEVEVQANTRVSLLQATAHAGVLS